MSSYMVKEYNRIEWRNAGGHLHRLDGPAVEYFDGSKYWYKNGQYHRSDGPSIECANGDKYWHQNGIRHRLDGPAIEKSDGESEYWINGEPYFPLFLDFEEIIKKIDNCEK